MACGWIDAYTPGDGAAVNHLCFTRAGFKTLPIPSSHSHVRPVIRWLAVGLPLLTSSAGAEPRWASLNQLHRGRAKGHTCYSTPMGDGHPLAPTSQGQSLQTVLLQGVRMP